jgi:cobalt-zinc-cadmium efflux system membrane fusion protein
MEATKVKEAEPETATEQKTEPQAEPPQTGDSGGFQWSRRSLIIAFALAVVAIGVVGAYMVRVSKSPSEGTRIKPEVTETTNGQPDPNIVATDPSQANDIKFETVGQQAFRVEKNATGKIGFDEEHMTPVFSPYTGRIMKLTARPGDTVKRGSPLLEIDTPDLVQAEQDLITGAASVQKARTVLELAHKSEARQRLLLANKAVSMKDYEQAESDLKNAESDLRSAEAAQSGARDRLRVLGKSDAEIDKISASRQIDRLTRIFSPIAGTITARKVGPGQWVKPDNPDPMFTIANLSTMWMLADVYESDVPLIKAGQQVEVRVMAYPTEPFKAHITYIGAAVDPNTHRVAVRAEVENRGLKLKPEMFASFKIITNAEVQALAVRTGAIVREGDKAGVWVALEPNKFARREVKLGIEQNGYVQILSGIQAGDRVVYEGSLFLSNLGKS